MLHLFYYSSFLFSLGMLAALLSWHKKNISPCYPALFIFITISAFGNMQLSFAESTEAAITSNQVMCLGGCFVPFFSFLCVSELTKVKVLTEIKIFLFIAGCAVFTLISTAGILPLYYKSAEMATWHGITYLVKDYGPFYLAYPVYVLVLKAFSLSLIIYSFRKKRQVPKVTSIILFCLLIIAFATYIVEKILDLKVELVPFAFNLEQIGIIFLLTRIKLYEVTAITASTIKSSSYYGILIFNKGGKFIGCDGSAKRWFPEIDSFFVDHAIPKEVIEKSDFARQIQSWIEGYSIENPVYFERDDAIIKASFSIPFEKKCRTIYQVLLQDDTEQQRLNKMIQQYNEKLEKTVDEKNGQLKDVLNDIIISMAAIVENRDGNTGGHIRRTSDVVQILVNRLMETGNFPELTPEKAKCIIKAAPLHDFGKIAVPDNILNKPGKFTPEEYEIMKVHSEKGSVIVAQILKNSDDMIFSEIAVNIAHYHHEKWNGTGYPCGLKEIEIPFEARIMALADVFDALVSKRVYKEQFSYDRAFGIIKDSCGQHFDPDLCKEFLMCRPQLEALYNSYVD